MKAGDVGKLANVLKKNADEKFNQGYICAVANILRMHDYPQVAKDVLEGAGVVDWSEIDEGDKAVLRKAGLI